MHLVLPEILLQKLHTIQYGNPIELTQHTVHERVVVQQQHWARGVSTLVQAGSSPHLAGPDVKGSVEREELLYGET